MLRGPSWSIRLPPSGRRQLHREADWGRVSQWREPGGQAWPGLGSCLDLVESEGVSAQDLGGTLTKGHHWLLPKRVI